MKTTSLAALLSLALTCTALADAPPLDWTRQLGGSGSDYGKGVSADGRGNVYISGHTWGSIEGPNAGYADAFLSKYDDTGSFQWTKQIGTAQTDVAKSVTTDGLGNVYISGATVGVLGDASAGVSDVFVSKYDVGGTLQWTRQFGTSDEDHNVGVAVDGFGYVYVAGTTEGSLEGANAGNLDVFVSRFSSAGTHTWTQQFGTTYDDTGTGVSVDVLGNVYISGHTRGSLDGFNAGATDTFVTKYNNLGWLQWTRQFGTIFGDVSAGVSVDNLGNVFVAGYTYGNLGGTYFGDSDTFVVKLDDDGDHQWTRQFGTNRFDDGEGVVTDGLGNVYVSGVTWGNLGGDNAGEADAFVRMYDTDGIAQWTQQLGTSADDVGIGVSVDRQGGVYITGDTRGDLDGTNAGGADAFLARYGEPIPVPGDGNGDGHVDGVDYIIWAENFGDDPADDPPGSPGNGDFDNNGIVDGVDYVTCAINFGQGPNDGVAVPEPSACALLVMGGLMLLPRRRKCGVGTTGA